MAQKEMLEVIEAKIKKLLVECDQKQNKLIKKQLEEVQQTGTNKKNN